MQNPKIPSAPLNKIALSCSGGGYRAAAFHLGSISYLNRLNYADKSLLENVKLISTVSGGSITGGVYALLKQEGKSFNEIYQILLHTLQKLDLVKMSIEKLNPNGQWKNSYKRKNLINAFAELYDEYFTSGATFKKFDVMHSHLEALIINSTEFRTGKNFRFRNLGPSYFGNSSVRVNASEAQEVKLADAIASSACFPVGFEPMVWPHDFTYDRASELQRLAKTSEPIGLMDGGIYDNQGINSILSYKNSEEQSYFDLVIVSDVTSPYMEPFIPSSDRPKEGFRSLTLKKVYDKLRLLNRNITITLITLTTMFAALPLLNNFADRMWNGFLLGLAFASCVMLLIKGWLLRKLKSICSNGYSILINRIPAFYREKLSNLKIEELTIRRAEPLLLDRLNSLRTLLLDVFLKVVRRLNYYKLYENEQYRFRRITTLIKELTEEDFNNRTKRKEAEIANSLSYINKSILKGPYHQVVGSAIQKIATEASEIGTALWFTEKEQLDRVLDKLVATGQFTMCYNMLDYLEAILFEENNGYKELDPLVQNNIQLLYEQCRQDWSHFKEDPLFMVNNQ